MTTLYGLDVVVTSDRPRYLLPDEVIPGVPWPKGFREEFNGWSRSYLGTWNMVPDGQVYEMMGRMLMNSSTYQRLRQLHGTNNFSGTRLV